MPLPLHLAIHFFLAVLSGYLVGRRFNKIEIGIIAGILGGFFIDFDHILEYFLFFGPHFNLVYFLQGREFLLTDKIYIWFHAWEYIPILLFVAWLWRSKKTVATFILALTLAGAVHLVTDSFINEYQFRNYSLIYRQRIGFSASRLLNPAQYEKYRESRRELGL
jgi:riboflavin transporter FmnP